MLRTSDRHLSDSHPARPGWSILWLALLSISIAAGVWLGLNLRRAQSSYPGLSPDIPLAADKSYGVNADLTNLPGSKLDQVLARMKELGLSRVRQPFPWAEIEPSPGQYDWSAWDRVVEGADAHGLELIAVLDTTPAWARPAGATPFTPPAELADFGAFARALAERYGDRLDHYQIWDEPNLSAHWGDQYVDPAAYARLLREGAINIRAADPGAVVLTAALAPTLETGPLNLNEPAFLEGLYGANAGEWFDVVAAQPYGFEQEPGAPAGEQTLNFARPELLRRVMLAHRDGEKPVWATAFGWNALPQPWTGKPSPWPAVSAEQQKAYTSQAIHQARANWPWLGPLFFTAWDAQMLPDDDPRRGLALVAGDDLSAQAQALRAGETAAVPGTVVATAGTYGADHPSGQYTGNWRLAPAGADVPRQPPAILTIPFEGTRLDLAVRRGAFRGFLYVTIDGKPANALPQQGGRAYVVLFDPLEETDEITLARYLPDGPHIARIEAEGGWYQWPVIGWRVSREADTRALRLGLALAGGLGVAAGAGLAFSMRHLRFDRVRGRIEIIYAHYRAWGAPVHLTVLGGVALAFYLAPGSLLSLGLLGLLFLAVLPVPNLGLALTAFSLPFFLLPKPLLGRTISMTEVFLVLTALACVTHRLAGLIGRPVSQPARSSLAWLDWTAWVLTGVAFLAGLLTLVPTANSGPLAAADWPVLALMLLPLAGVLAAIAQAKENSPRLLSGRVRSLDLAVMALVGLSLAATLAAESFGISLQEFHVVVWDGAAFYALVRLLPGPGSKTRGANSGRLAWSLVDAFLLGAGLMALYAIYQYFFTDQVITAENVRRALGVYGSPNNLALLLDRALPVLLAVAAAPWLVVTGPDEGASGRARRMLYGLGLGLALIALLLTYSRGALLLGVPAAILFLALVRRGRILWITLGGLIAGGLALVSWLGGSRLRSLLDTSAGTGFFRIRLWQSAWAMLRDHPWLGVGLDNFLYQYRTRYMLPDAWQEPNLSHPHNIVLDFGTRLGAGGVVVLLWLQVAFWRTAWQSYQGQRQAEARALILGLMASMVASLAHGLVDNSFFLVDLGFIFFLTAGVIGRLAASND
ncbi:MAG: O-antigen ligase family protein [Anaerolineae bacterium]